MSRNLSLKSRLSNASPFLVLLPSLILVFIFVYVFIGTSFFYSLTNWKSLAIDLSVKEPLFSTYGEMFGMPRFQADLRNTFVFTSLFILLSIALGLFLAILLDRTIRGIGIFRNLFLFPYALSFIVAGVSWRWIFNPETGINLLFNTLGINSIRSDMGMEALKPGWMTNADVVWSLNGMLEKIWPGGAEFQIEWGIPIALIPIVVAATWQLSGFVMAMYLGGLGGVSESVKESARIAGAGEWTLYRKVVIPMLKPITISVAIILIHVSLKIFDLVYAMSGVGPGFATDVPGIFVFEMMFKATRYNLGSAASMVMLFLSCLVIVPYLISMFKNPDG